MFNSIRFKISVLFTAVLGLILLVYSSYLYFNLSTFVYYEVDKNLTAKIEAFEAIIEEYATYLEPDSETAPDSLARVIELIANPKKEFFQAPKIKELDQKWTFKIHELALKRDFIVVYYPAGDIAIKSNNIIDDDILAQMQKSFTATPHERLFIQDVISGELKLRIISKPFDRFGRVQYILQLATSMDDVLFRIKRRFALIFISIPIALIVMSILAWFYVVMILQPISTITKAAAAITHKDMSKRVTQTLADPEIKALADAFNNMIERLERSFQYIQDFSYDVAHELRTPLAIIRGEAEVALRRDRSAEEYKKALETCLDETGTMLKMVEDLLLLTKLESQPHAISFEDLDLNAFLEEFYEQVKIIAKNKSMIVSLTVPKRSKKIHANKLHLRRLFFNLVDNAIKFTPAKGKIDIIAEYENKHVRISITDNGIGIAQEDIPKLMKRFFHRESPELATEAGHGLGLSLVHYIAKVHQGKIEVRSVKGKGSTFSVILPVVG
ncbi:MAG: HAMP domain-containing protein [Candidatus Omnitrophica bacterium]|nr:HAMP domain-containing protein [Candidatus Omnitrophota bacterium]